MKLKESALLGEITLTKEHQDSLISLLSFIKTADEENMIKLMHVFGFILQKTIFDNKIIRTSKCLDKSS